MTDRIIQEMFSESVWAGGSGDLSSENWIIGFNYDETTGQYLDLIYGTAGSSVVFGATLPPPYESQPTSLGGTLTGSLSCEDFSMQGGGSYILAGTLSAASGDIAEGTSLTVDASGTLDVGDLTFSGEIIVAGLLDQTIIEGGSVVISGGTATDVELDSGAITITAGSALDTRLEFGEEEIFSGGVASSTLVEEFGDLIVSGGGTARNTTVIDDGSMDIFSGAVISGVVLSSGGTANVYSGAAITGISATSNGVVKISGGIVSGAVISASDEFVYSGGTATGTTLNSGSEIIYSGGVASRTIVDSGSLQQISGGSAVSATVNSGIEQVYSGGTADETIVNSGGIQQLSGGTALSATVNIFGSQLVLSGGVASATTLSGAAASAIISGVPVSFFNFAVEAVSSGGSAYSAVLNAGGELVVFSGGVASGAMVNSGGTARVSSGGTASDTIVSGVLVSSGTSGVSQPVYQGGFLAITGGTAISTTLVAGGDERILSDGTASQTIVSGGGVEEVWAGVATATTVSSGGVQQIIGGSAVSAMVDGGGVQFIIGSGVASDTIVSGGFENLSAGGLAYSAGQVIAENGGTTSDTLVGSGGLEYSFSRGHTVSTTLNAGGGELVFSGGMASGTTVNSGGYESVSSGGSSIRTTVNNGGYERVFSGGTDSNAIVNSGGGQYVFTSGTANSTTVSGGGTIFVQSGGVASNTILLPGGTIDVTYLPYVAGGSAGVNTSGLLTVIEGGNTYQQQLSGDYSSEAFATSPDGNSGTDITVAGSVDLGYAVWGGSSGDLSSVNWIIGYIEDVNADGTPGFGGWIYSLAPTNGSTLSFQSTLSALGVVNTDVGGPGIAVGALTTSDELDVGLNNGSADVLDGNLTVDDAEITTGTLAVSGDAAVLTIGGSLQIDEGQLLVANTGSASTADGIYVGYDDTDGQTTVTSDATLVVSGNGSQLTDSGDLYVGGEFDVSGGGQVTVAGLVNLLDDSLLSVDSASSMEIGGSSNLAAGTIVVDSGQSITGSGEIDGAIDNNGQIIASNSDETLTVDGGVMGTGVGTIDNNSTLELMGPVSAGQNITFAGSSGTLILDDPADFQGAITGVEPGDTIEFPNIGAISVFQVSGSTWNILLGSGKQIPFSGNLGASIPIVESDGNVGTALEFDTVPVVAINATINGTIYHGSGLVIGPHSILTAAHVVWNSAVDQSATSIAIYPNGNNGDLLVQAVLPPCNIVPTNSAESVSGSIMNLSFNEISAPGGTDTAQSLPLDFAVINVDSSINLPYASVPILLGYDGDGPVDMGGYPAPNYGLYVAETGITAYSAQPSGVFYDLAATFVPNIYNNTGTASPAAPGMSGGPLLLEMNNSLQDVGVITSVTDSVQLNSINNAIIQNWENAVQCYVEGTLILTASGEVAVESLECGDSVLTIPNKIEVPIIWVGHRRVDCCKHPKPQIVWPVCVRAGAFGDSLPHRDLWLSPDHAVYVFDELIPIKYLINGTTIKQVPMDEVTYYHVELEHHDILLAEGLPAESFLDIGDRLNFDNGGKSTALHPNFWSHRRDMALIWDTLGYAPLTIAGSKLHAARLRIADVTAALQALDTDKSIAE